MRRRDNPISLFSFQDIITSLTGVMILIVLIILLQLFDATQQAINNLNADPERKALQLRKQEILKEMKQLEETIQAEQLPTDYAEMPLQQLKINQKALELSIRQRQKQLQKSIQTVDNQKRQVEEIRQQVASMEPATPQKRTDSQLQMRSLADKVNRLQKKIQTLNQKQAQNSKRLVFSFSGTMTKKPLLVECTGWGFRCKRYPDGDVKTFGSKGSTLARKHIPDLRAWILNFDLETHYPVFLFRQEALTSFHEIISIVYGRCAWGKDLVKDEEVCF